MILKWMSGHHIANMSGPALMIATRANGYKTIEHATAITLALAQCEVGI